jgi:hypothetical protein
MNTKLASTTAASTYAGLASPTFTGTVTTASSSGDSQIAITAPATNSMSRITLSTPASSGGGSGNEIIFKEGTGGGGANNSKFDFHHSPNSGIFLFRADGTTVWSVPEGSTTTTFQDIYCNDISVADIKMSNDRPDVPGNEIDGTKGSWTFQEGSDDMYLINRKSGKRYKLMLDEV